jgi:TM2 domain-containing membrane protein YozV
MCEIYTANVNLKAEFTVLANTLVVANWFSDIIAKYHELCVGCL